MYRILLHVFTYIQIINVSNTCILHFYLKYFSCFGFVFTNHLDGNGILDLNLDSESKTIRN